MLYSTYSSAENSTQSPIVISPIVKENSNASRKVRATRNGMEGWGHASFVIDAQGIPQNIVIFDYSGEDRYIKASERYIENLTYSPASIDGINTTSHEIIFIRHSISGEGVSGNSVTPKFLEEYQEIMNKMLGTNADLPNIEELIEDLKDDHTKNLNEQALMAWLESIYFYKIKDFQQHMRQSRIVTNLNPYIPVKMLSKAVVNLYESELFYGYYLEAQETVDEMSNMGGLEIRKDIQNQLQARVTSTISNKEPHLLTKGKIMSLESWILRVFKPKIIISNVKGNINSVELRCTGHYSKHNDGWDNGITVPNNAKLCSVLVSGDTSTSFDLLQSDLSNE